MVLYVVLPYLFLELSSLYIFADCKKNTKHYYTGLYCIYLMSVWRYALVFFVLLSVSALALPDFTLNTTLNDNSFYTMPLLSAKILEYNYSSSFSGIPLDTEVIADIVKGTTVEPWANASFGYRVPITQIATNSSTRATSFQLSTEQLISNGKLRSDCSDLRLYHNRSTQIPIHVTDCNTNVTRLWFRVQTPIAPTLYLYYDNPTLSTQIPSSSVFTYYEDFETLSDFSEDWIVSSGNVTVSGNLVSALNTTTMINLTNTSIAQDSEFSYDLSLALNASATLYFAASTNLSDRSLSVSLHDSNNTVAVCWNQNGNNDCSVYTRQIDVGTRYSLKLLFENNSADIFLDDQKLNQLPQYYTVSSASVVAVFSEGVTFDTVRFMQKKQDTFIFHEEQEHIQRFTGTAFSGFYGFTTDLTGLLTDTYSITTYATRAGMNPQITADTFTTTYRKIILDTVEAGVVSLYAGRFIVDTTGTLKVTNSNDESIPVLINIDAPIIVDQISGTSLSSRQLSVTVGPFSTVSIPYLTSGILSINPTEGTFGVLSTLLNTAINPDYYELSSSFTKEGLDLGTTIIEEEEDDTVRRKEIRYTVQGDFILDQFSKLRIHKYFSDISVKKGEIIDVILQVSNQDPFSRPVSLTDFIPSEFVFVDNYIPKEEKELGWDFKMNKFSSRVFSYQMMYIGNSTGLLQMPQANLTSDRLLVYSNNISLVRLQNDASEIFVTKEVEIWNGTPLYDQESTVRVTISVANTGRSMVEELFVDDYTSETKLFVNPTQDTIYKAKWVIDRLNPGDVWYVSYLTNNRDSIEVLPVVSSYVQDVAVTGHVISDSQAKIGIWKSPWTRFSLLIFVLLFIIADICVIGYYVYKNPFFETEGDLSFSVFMREIFKRVNIFPKFFAKVRRSVSYLTSITTKMYMSFITWFASFRKRAKSYYKEHNVSLVEEKTSPLMKKVQAKLAEWRKRSVKEWLALFHKKVQDVIIAVHNYITYGMFRFSNKLLERNDQSKLGRILNFSAKVLNPDLKGYMGHLISKKMEKKQHAYQKEIDAINKLRERNKKLSSGNFLVRLKNSIQDFFERLF
jgi:hypothetical protein